MIDHKPTWHRLTKEDGRAVFSGHTAKTPGTGVWLATLSRMDGGQTTVEAIAVNGVTVYQTTCYCGQHRHQVIIRAGNLLLGKD